MKICKLILQLLIPLFFVLCSEDDGTDIMKTGTLTIEGTDYSLSHGEIAVSGEITPPGDVYGHLVYLLSSDFNLTETEVQGTGQLIELHFWTLSADYIEPGTYTIFDEENPDVNTFINGFYKSLNRETNVCTNYYLGVSGTITVVKTGSTYTLTMNILTDKYANVTMGVPPAGNPIATGITVVCSFTGELKQKYFG